MFSVGHQLPISASGCDMWSCLRCLPGKQIRSYEALDGKNPITALCTTPTPHCSVVFGSADSVLRFIDPRKPGLQVLRPQLSTIYSPPFNL